MKQTEMLNLAQAHFLAGRMAESIETITKLLESGAYPPMIHTFRGQVYLKIGEIDKATDDFDKATLDNSDYFQAYLYRGMVALMAGKNESALLDFNRVLELRPGYGDALVARAAGLSRLNRINEAAADIKKIVSHPLSNGLKLFVDNFGLLRTEVLKIIAEVSGEVPEKAIKMTQKEIAKLKELLGEAP